MKGKTAIRKKGNLKMNTISKKRKRIYSQSKLAVLKRELSINDGKTIAQIQQQFNNYYPFLKLEFFSVQNKRNQFSRNSKIISHDKKIGELRKIKGSFKISIAPEITVLQVEQKFENIFGLHVKVFRRSGNMWIESNLTDGWPLAKQNQEGLELSKPLKKLEEKNEFSNQDTT